MLRPYDREKDREACRRIWVECGWAEPDKAERVDGFIDACRARVAELNGAAECLVLTADGLMRYLDDDIRVSCVTGVTTSRVARKQGFAARLLAEAAAEDASNGALVSVLCMFEQGFYNRLGYGTLGYEHRMTFDPSHLTIDRKPPVPVRLGADDWNEIHSALVSRFRAHGGVVVAPPELVRYELRESEEGFGLGFRDGGGTLTHFFWASCDNVEEGPYTVNYIAYRTADQLLDLLALIKGLGDQVRSVKMHEPAEIQIQDLVSQPFKHRTITKGAEHEANMTALAYFQARICNLPECMARTRIDGPTIRFNLELSDPIEAYLGHGTPWRGVGGSYIIQIGPESFARAGRDESLPTLKAAIGAFTRMWVGVRPATGLSITDEVSGPPELLKQLDRTLRIPQPQPGWDF